MPDVVSMNGVLTQIGNNLVKLMTVADYEALFPVFERQCAGPMLEEQEPTRVQVTCYKEVERVKKTLYVDFAVWGPHPNRSERLRAMEGVRLDAFGKLVPLVLYGPENISVWLKCFRIWRNATLMLEFVPQETLNHYPERVHEMADKYPDYLWPLLYQADVRARSEHLLKLARRCREAKKKADNDNVSHPYDPAKPWSYPFQLLAMGEKDFWDREFKEPARDIMNKLAKLDEAVEGDAMVSTTSASSTSRPASITTLALRDASPSHAPPRTTRTRTPSQEIWLPGWSRVNRKDAALCCGFQHGECTATLSGFCALDTSKKHQCAICLSNSHGAKNCPNKGKDLGGSVIKKKKGRRAAKGGGLKKGKP